jgi:hypothetical protein
VQQVISKFNGTYLAVGECTAGVRCRKQGSDPLLDRGHHAPDEGLYDTVRTSRVPECVASRARMFR